VQVCVGRLEGKQETKDRDNFSTCEANKIKVLMIGMLMKIYLKVFFFTISLLVLNNKSEFKC